METQNNPLDRNDTRNRSNLPFGGIVLIVIGTVFLLHQLDLGLPHWLISWPMILIGIGVFAGARRGFVPGGWIIPLAIGAFFLVEHEFMDRSIRHIFWPVFLIAMGLYMVLRPRRSWKRGLTSENSSQDFVDSSVAFGGIKKNIISKDFQGGRIDNIFGGTDINMMQADFKGVVVMDFNVAFGGIKLVVPPHWNIRNEITAILGGVDDKRPQVQQVDEPGKVLVLKGSVMFGGVDIKSY